MRVTTKGQVTIPQHIREKLGITPATEVDFVEEEGRIFLPACNAPDLIISDCLRELANISAPF